MEGTSQPWSTKTKFQLLKTSKPKKEKEKDQQCQDIRKYRAGL